MQKLKCMWCHGEFDDVKGVVHEYIESTPGCWAAYSKLLSLEYENYPVLGNIHRLTVDTYAAQHPGKPSKRSIQSVWGHLVAMYFFLDKGMDGERTRSRLGRFVQSNPDLVWLSPPDFSRCITVAYPLSAQGTDDHVKKVMEWGRSVYQSWMRIHGQSLKQSREHSHWEIQLNEGVLSVYRS
jgi:hypothetical protein